MYDAENGGATYSNCGNRTFTSLELNSERNPSNAAKFVRQTFEAYFSNEGAQL